MNNLKEKISKLINKEFFNNIYFFFLNFFVKNIKINGILMLFLLFTGGVYLHNQSFISGALIGIISSAMASFNLIDGYKEYKIRSAKIILLSYLKSETDGLLETMIGYVKNIFEKIKNTATDNLKKDSAMHIEFAACDIFVKHHNSTRIKLVSDIGNLAKSIFNYCVKYNTPQDLVDFNVAIYKLISIKEIVSSQLILINDESVLEAYTELILIMSQINSKDLLENVPIVIGGGQDMKLIIDCLYLLTNCYDSLLRYKKQLDEYVTIRNNKHYDFFSLCDSLRDPESSSG